jgi:N-methylhydantoinase A
VTRRIRIGIDTGGTFTDVVAVDEESGALVVTKTPSTPRDPALGFMTGVRKVLDELGLDGSAVSAVSHGTTVATNKLLEGKVQNLGFITTEGYEFLLEIARQSVPDGYGNSYFWVKPDRIVPAHRVKAVGGRLSVRGEEIRPFDEASAVAAARFFRDAGIASIGVCFLHSYVDDSHERAMRDVLAREHPGATVSISSEVLREYREYERAVTTLVDAAVKPDIRSYVANIAAHLADLAGHPAEPHGRTEGAAATVDGSGGRREAPDGSGAPPLAGRPEAGRVPEGPVPASTVSTLPKNSAAMRLDTPTSIRCPTPPIIPPTTASAS